MKEKLEDPKHMWGKLASIIKKVLITLKKHEDIGVFKKRFKTYHKEFSNNKTEILLLSISMIITYYSTQSATNLTIHIGERVSFLLYRSSSINKGYVKNPKEDYKN